VAHVSGTVEGRAAETIRSVLVESGLRKSELCARAGVSRALLDDYLRGAKQPSLAQIERIVDAARMRLRLSLSPKPRPASQEFVAAVDLAEALSRGVFAPLAFPYGVWQKA